MRRAVCEHCGRVAWVNITVPLLSHITGRYAEFCADCFEVVPHVQPRRNPRQRGSGPDSNDPGFDNVVRALEEDR